jgi:hypothetical protein
VYFLTKCAFCHRDNCIISISILVLAVVGIDVVVVVVVVAVVVGSKFSIRF